MKIALILAISLCVIAYSVNAFWLDKGCCKDAACTPLMNCGSGFCKYTFNEAGDIESGSCAGGTISGPGADVAGQCTSDLTEPCYIYSTARGHKGLKRSGSTLIMPPPFICCSNETDTECKVQCGDYQESWCISKFSANGSFTGTCEPYGTRTEDKKCSQAKVKTMCSCITTTTPCNKGLKRNAYKPDAEDGPKPENPNEESRSTRVQMNIMTAVYPLAAFLGVTLLCKM